LFWRCCSAVVVWFYLWLIVVLEDPMLWLVVWLCLAVVLCRFWVDIACAELL
jgi:hypothetical protein